MFRICKSNPASRRRWRKGGAGANAGFRDTFLVWLPETGRSVHRAESMCKRVEVAVLAEGRAVAQCVWRRIGIRPLTGLRLLQWTR
jgi:hypothetical protein